MSSSATCSRDARVAGTWLIGFSSPQSWIMPLYRTAMTSTPAASSLRAYSSPSSRSTSPEEEREVFSLVRIQGMTHGEVAELLQTSTKTVQRRLNRALIILSDTLSDLNPTPPPSNDT